MQKIEKFLFKYPFILILLLSAPAIWALFVPGFYGASDDLHIAWLQQLDVALRSGQIPPRFVPDLSFGFGYPLFNFVFPLPFYIGEVIHSLGFSFVDSIKTVFFLSIPLSGYFMYKFLKEYGSSWIALAGSIIYVYTPYRSTDIYVRGAFGEALAFIFPPLIAWGIARASKDKNYKWAGVISLGIAGLILSHNIMAYMFTPFLLLFVLLIGFNIKTILGFILGLATSAYFWLPAIVESRLMKYDTVFNFVDHFPTLRQLVTPYFGYGASVPGPYDGMSFFVGLLNLLLIFFAVVLIKKLNRISVWAIVMIAVSVFMMNYRSTFIWKLVPLIPYFQFPWRFLSLTTFATSLLVLIFDKLKYSKYFAIAITFLAIIINFSFFRPHDFLGRSDQYYLNRYVPYPTVSSDYLQINEEYLRLPKATEKRPTALSPDRKLDTTFEVKTEITKKFEYYKYYFPGWNVWIDGQKVPVHAGSPYGQIEFDVPSGTHSVRVAFKETLFRGVLDIISLTGLLFSVVLILRPTKKK